MFPCNLEMSFVTSNFCLLINRTHFIYDVKIILFNVISNLYWNWEILWFFFKYSLLDILYVRAPQPFSNPASNSMDDKTQKDNIEEGKKSFKIDDDW